ncbi:MAG TPA: HD domain-containing phosphohydrolase, partial [Candidatus Saccharimonadales bacterium]|nr:HD domain-containing phosphohydrolase [Candidatus Saccharimonadales bacterium]
YEVETALSAQEALQRVQQKSYALVMTDQRMPGMTGVDLLSRIQEIQPDTTRILITGVVELNTVIDSINKGEIYRFLMKPWLNEELLLTVRNGVQRYELIQRNAKLHDETVSMNERLVELNEELRAWVLREEAQNLELAKLNRTLQQNLQRSIELCLKTMEAFHPALGVQARRVHSLCSVMAERICLSEPERHVLEISAWLHDIGFLAVPRKLIKIWERSPEQLSAADLASVHQHPALGAELARFVHDLAEVGHVIRSHHERFDGKGFPDRLSGDKIPWLGRLLAVAVAYTEAEQKEQDAASVLKKGSGKQFDPEAVRALLSTPSNPPSDPKEREIQLGELKPGMTIARDIHNAKGKLLISGGEVLTKPAIQKLQKEHRVRPIEGSLLVYCS